MKPIKMFSSLFVFAVASLMACSDAYNNDDSYEPTSQEEQIEIRNTSAFGNILVDQDGNSLYFFAKDATGESQCNGACIDSWPIYHLEEIEVGEGLDERDFKTIVRADGKKQTTFKGWPLYLFAGDNASGDINGDGVGKVWYVAKPDYSVMLAEKEVNAVVEKYLVDAQGNTLYFFTLDGTEVSNCNGDCAVVWPPLNASNLVVPSFFPTDSQFGFFTRENGDRQMSFQGRPLYLFNQDNYRGDTEGHGLDNVFFILNESVLTK